MFTRLSIAILAVAALAGSAQAHGRDDRGAEILRDLPADAPPGDCYARVRAPGEPIAQPPVAVGAHWVQTPGPPGSPGPIWCLIPTDFRAQAPIPTIIEGWIRVLCDRDATPDRVRGVQRRLHERGYYRGEMNGRYDADTAAAVGRFQSEARIAHGGYLSLDTLDALGDRPGYDESPYGPERGYVAREEDRRGDQPWEDQWSDRRDWRDEGRHGIPQGPAPPPCLEACAYAPPPPPVYRPAPCGCVGPQAYRPYHPVPPYAARGGYYGASAIRDGWLTWSGKIEF